MGCAAMLALVTLLVAQEAKRIPTDEAMSNIVSRVSPEYLPIARQVKLSGDVEVQATINENGSVDEVSIVKGNPILAKAAIEAVKKWKFKPFKSKVISNFTIGFK